MEQTHTIKAVIFDLDGVIADTAHLHFIAWKHFADSLDIPFDLEYNENLKGVSRMESLELLLKNAPSDLNLSQSEKEKIAHEKNEYYVSLLADIQKEDVLPGILSFLNALKEHGVKTAIASASHNAPMILKQLGLFECFDYICNPAEVAQPKPAPDIFICAANALGESVHDCIGVEDSQAGITSINDSKMMSVGVGSPSQMHEAYLKLTDTSDLKWDVVCTAYHQYKNQASVALT